MKRGCVMLLMVLFTAFFGAFAVSAAPRLDNAPATFSHGQTVNISGADFGAKVPAAPLLWDTFENGTNGAAILESNAVIGDWDYGAGYDNVYYTNAMHYGSSGTMAARNQFAPWGIAGGDNSSLSKNGTFPVIYMDYKRFYPASNGYSSNHKQYRMYGANDTIQVFVAHACEEWGVAEMSGVDQDDGGTYTGTEWDVKIPVMNVWEHYQLIFRESSTPTSKDGVIRMFVDGEESGFNRTNMNTRNSASEHFDQIRIGHYLDANPRPGDNLFCDASNSAVIYHDNVYIDTTWARVELGNAATYAASTHREIQIPTTWANDGTSITINVNTGTFAVGQTAYLYVFNAAGEVNNAGRPVVIGSGASVAPPAAPAGLTVQ